MTRRNDSFFDRLTRSCLLCMQVEAPGGQCERTSVFRCRSRWFSRWYQEYLALNLTSTPSCPLSIDDASSKLPIKALHRVRITPPRIHLHRCTCKRGIPRRHNSLSPRLPRHILHMDLPNRPLFLSWLPLSCTGFARVRSQFASLPSGRKTTRVQFPKYESGFGWVSGPCSTTRESRKGHCGFA